jgi:hypothetical protein
LNTCRIASLRVRKGAQVCSSKIWNCTGIHQSACQTHGAVAERSRAGPSPSETLGDETLQRIAGTSLDTPSEIAALAAMEEQELSRSR